MVGTAYDVPRRLLHAITYQAGGPLQVIDLANPKDLRLRSTLDGVAGFTSLLRPIAGGQFLLTAEDLRDHIGGDTLQLPGCPRGSRPQPGAAPSPRWCASSTSGTPRIRARSSTGVWR